MIFLRQFKHVLPRAKAWSLTIDKRLRQFFDGLTVLGVNFKAFMDDVYGDLFPATTRELDMWEQQFGLPTDSSLTEQERRDRIDAAWKALGGQSPRYIQDTLQAAGFDVYVHEWWVPGTEPPVGGFGTDFLIDDDDNFIVDDEDNFGLAGTGSGGSDCAEARDPSLYVAPGNFLVNKLVVSRPDYVTLAGEAEAACGEPEALCGNFLNIIDERIVYEAPEDPAKWPYVLYIGGETFPNTAEIPEERREEFENLLLKICPAQQWIGLLTTPGNFGLNLGDADLQSLEYVNVETEVANFGDATLQTGSS